MFSHSANVLILISVLSCGIKLAHTNYTQHNSMVKNVKLNSTDDFQTNTFTTTKC